MSMKPDTSFEFIAEWFETAKENAEKQGRDDSARLWDDGLHHLKYLKEENDEMRLAMTNFVNRVDIGEVRSRQTYAKFKEILGL